MVKDLALLKDEVGKLFQTLAAQERRLAMLERKRIVAGNGIRITEDNADTLCIEAEEVISGQTGDDTENTAEMSEITAGYGLIAERQDDMLRLELDRSVLPDSEANTKFSKEPDFPFKVKISGLAKPNGSNTTLTVCGGVTSCVYAGTYDPITVTSTNLTVTTECYVILKITADLNSTHATLETRYRLPEISDSEFYVPLAWISYSAGYAEVRQMHFGNVYVAGRII